jgi:selenium metabolism protein YedF
MTEIKLDVRGKTCPQPVIETRKALDDKSVLKLTVLVDNEAAAENVARTGRSLGCEVKRKAETGNEISIVLTRSESAEPDKKENADKELEGVCGAGSNVAVLISSGVFGSGDDELGRALLHAFIGTLKEVVPRPRTLMFVNGGAPLACKGSEFVKPIRELEKEGIEVLVCGTCLDWFHLEDKVEVGRISNMFDITSALMAADRVVRP